MGTLTSALVTAVPLSAGTWSFVPALPVLGNGPAWPSHWLIEQNRPATFGHPSWPLRGDLRMTWTMLRGDDGKLEGSARASLEAHPRDRSRGSSLVTIDP